MMEDGIPETNQEWLDHIERLKTYFLIAGLKEALEIAQRHDDPHWGAHEPMNAMARRIVTAISSRISILEGE